MGVDSGQVKQWAGELGYDLVGIAPAVPPDKAECLAHWLGRGFHGDMHYLQHHLTQRIDPTEFVPGAKSIICTALSYWRPPPESLDQGATGRIARYAWGRDYHEIMREKLKQLASRIGAATDGAPRLRCCVDTAPLLEKAHAARAGLGWIGANTLLINQRFGSWLVLGEIVTDLELTFDDPVDPRCGECHLCLNACPTRALCKDFVLDARRCISYLTIESRNEIPPELAQLIGESLFGCDACQENCPFNQQPAPGWATRHDPQPRWAQPSLTEILSMTLRQFETYFAGSAMTRVQYDRFLSLARNCLSSKEEGRSGDQKR